MLTDIDLDVRNYVENVMDEDETIIFVHSCGDDFVNILNGEVVDMVNLLLETEDLYDVILNVAGNIVVDKDIDFDAVVEFIKKAKK